MEQLVVQVFPVLHDTLIRCCLRVANLEACVGHSNAACSNLEACVGRSNAVCSAWRAVENFHPYAGSIQYRVYSIQYTVYGIQYGNIQYAVSR